MSKTFTIELPKGKMRHPIGIMQERKQIMKDRRTRRSKDARRSWQKEWV